MTNASVLGLLILATVVPPLAPPAHPQPVSPSRPAAAPPEPAAQSRRIRVPGTTVEFEVALVPGVAAGHDGAAAEIPDLWVLTTEVTWDLYDVFVYALDQPEGEAGGADAVARPSKPYVPPDRGFGHSGYPAIGMTRHAAESFCAWLSGKTGMRVRLPTDTEWTHFARANSVDPYWFGAADSVIDGFAWCRGNSSGATHPVGRTRVSPFGLFDVHGNVAEWVLTDTRRSVAMGGSYRDEKRDCTATSSQMQDSSWNTSDPQIPKSRWWLADCSWAGFRFVIETDDADSGDQEVSDEP